jgi:hypothetical protein
MGSDTPKWIYPLESTIIYSVLVMQGCLRSDWEQLIHVLALHVSE